MKKIFFSLLAVAAFVVTSCSSKTSKNEAADEGALIKAKIEHCQNHDSLKIYVQQAKRYVADLMKKGNNAAAKAYIDEVAPVVRAKDSSVASWFESVGTKADKAVDTTIDKAEDLNDKAKENFEEGKEKADKAVKDTKKKAADIADEAKEKTVDAAQSAADKVKDVLGK